MVCGFPEQLRRALNELQTTNIKPQTKEKCLLFIAVPVSTDKKTGIVILPHSSNQQQVKLSKD